MNRYERPMIIAYQDTAEGVYLASGGAADNSDTANNIKCDSQYMNGNWQAPDYSGWNGGTRGYRQQFGCLGCPAYTATACGLETHYVDSGYIYKGVMSCHDLVTNFYLKNPYNFSDEFFICAKSTFLQGSITTGLLSALSQSLRNPYATKVIFSLTPLEQNEKLKEW